MIQALVAGVNLMLYPNCMQQFSAIHMLSPEGISHSFDGRANGYGCGEGIGCLVVKRLADALRDGDTVRAVIRNTGVNADGKTPSLTQPSAEAQASLIRRTYAAAGLSLSSTEYFECHGTGTPVGVSLRLLHAPATPLSVVIVDENVVPRTPSSSRHSHPPSGPPAPPPASAPSISAASSPTSAILRAAPVSPASSRPSCASNKAS